MIRKAVAANAFYPGDARQLAKTLQNYLTGSPAAAGQPALRGLIVPHAGYIYSGAVAASAYRLLSVLPARPYRVFLLGPAHFVAAGAALGLFEAFVTPLGQVEVDLAFCRRLLKTSPLFTDNRQAHLPEHSLEVQLPFLQQTLPHFRLVPLLLGGKADPRAVAAALQPYFLNKNSLFIFSSDLSHYHPYTEARCLDRVTLDVLCSLDLGQSAQMEACGDNCLQVAMRLARLNNCSIELLAYKNSGDTTGSKDSVVGYAACAIYHKA